MGVGCGRRKILTENDSLAAVVVSGAKADAPCVDWNAAFPVLPIARFGCDNC